MGHGAGLGLLACGGAGWAAAHAGSCAREGGGRLGLGQKREGKDRKRNIFSFCKTEILNYFVNQFPNYFQTKFQNKFEPIL